jgi:MFS family permease
MFLSIVSSFLCGIFIERFGRKTLLIFSQLIIIAMMGLVVLTEYIGWPDYLGVIGVAIYIFGFYIGTGPITWVYMADVLPDVGISFTAATLWLFATAMGLLFPWVKDTYSICTAFDIFLGASIVGLLFDIFLIEETKGQS